MRRNLLLGLLLTFALCINGVFVYMATFIWKLEFYYAFAITFVIVAAIISRSLITRVIIENRKKFLQELLVVLALCLNYGCASFVSLIWNVDFIYYLAFVSVISIIASIVVTDPTRSLIYVCLSLVVGAVIAVCLAAMPPLMFGESLETVNWAIITASGFVSKLLIFGMIFSILGALTGYFLSDIFQ